MVAKKPAQAWDLRRLSSALASGARKPRVTQTTTRTTYSLPDSTINPAHIRYVVTSLTKSSAEHIYDTLYCARDQAENLIKRHKAQLASDRTSCISANANEMRQILHTAAYWLLWRIQQAISKATALATAEFAMCYACPDETVFKDIATRFPTAPT